MPITISTSNTKFYIGGILDADYDDFDATDFSGQSWVEIEGTENLGQSGDTSEVIKASLINRGRVAKAKGPRDAGTMEVVAALNIKDLGQLALIAAEKTRNAYAFKLAFDDAPAGGTPSIRYFTALVMSVSEGYNSATDHIELRATLEIDSNIVRVAAAEA